MDPSWTAHCHISQTALTAYSSHHTGLEVLLCAEQTQTGPTFSNVWSVHACSPAGCPNYAAHHSGCCSEQLCYSSALFPVCNDNFSRHVKQNKSQCNEDDFSKYYFYKCGINQWWRSVLGRNGGWAGSWGHCDRLARQTMEWNGASGASQLTVQYMTKHYYTMILKMKAGMWRRVGG